MCIYRGFKYIYIYSPKPGLARSMLIILIIIIIIIVVIGKGGDANIYRERFDCMYMCRESISGISYS